jgi:vacuolar protein sorting-associated protein 26
MFGLLEKKPEISLAIKGNDSLVSYRDLVCSLPFGAYTAGDRVEGNYTVTPSRGKASSHRGVTLVLFGDFQTSSGHRLSRFYERVQYLAPVGKITQLSAPFSFDNVNFPTGTYYGPTMKAVYGVEIRIKRRVNDWTQAAAFLVFLFDDKPNTMPIHNEIGMTNVLHIELVFARRDFDCRASVVGAAYFLLVKLRIIHMQVLLYCEERVERAGRGSADKNILKTWEFLDGALVRGDSVPIRLFLGECDIWPYRPFPDSALKVDWFLRAQLTDENGKNYYKRLRVRIVRARPGQPAEPRAAEKQSAQLPADEEEDNAANERGADGDEEGNAAE